MSEINSEVKDYLKPLIKKLSGLGLNSEYSTEGVINDSLVELEGKPEFIKARDDKNTSYFEIVFKDLLQDKILELIDDESKDFVQEIGNVLDFIFCCSQKNFTSKYFANQCLLKVSKLAPFNQLPKFLEFLESRVNILMTLNASHDYFAPDLVKMTNNMLGKLEGEKFSDIRGKIIWFTSTIVDYKHASGANMPGAFNSSRRFPSESNKFQVPNYSEPYFEQPINVLDEYLAKPKCILESDANFQDFQDLVKKLFEEISKIRNNTQKLTLEKQNTYYEISKFKLIEIIFILNYLRAAVEKDSDLSRIAKYSNENELNSAKTRFNSSKNWDTRLKDSCYRNLRIVGFKNMSFIKDAERREKYWSKMKTSKTFNFNSKQETDVTAEFEQKMAAYKTAVKSDPSQVKPSFKAISSEFVNKKRQAIESDVEAKRAKLSQLPDTDFSKYFEADSALEFSKYAQVEKDFSTTKGLLPGFDAEKLSDYSKKVNETKLHLEELKKYSPFQDTALCWKLMRKLRAKNLKVCNEKLDMGPGFSVDRMTGFIFSNSSKPSKPGTISPKETQVPNVKEDGANSNGATTPKEQAPPAKPEPTTNSGTTTPN